MKKSAIALIAFFLISRVAIAEKSPYKINDAEIEILFESSSEIPLAGLFSENRILNGSSIIYSVKTDDEEKRITAGILGILLGGLGIHRFYLGHNRAAFLGYCLPSFCFGLGAVPGLIDGIMYLIATDEEFNRKYRDNQKIWVWLD